MSTMPFIAAYFPFPRGEFTHQWQKVPAIGSSDSASMACAIWSRFQPVEDFGLSFVRGAVCDRIAPLPRSESLARDMTSTGMTTAAENTCPERTHCGRVV
jgi:hypothetical protein